MDGSKGRRFVDPNSNDKPSTRLWNVVNEDQVITAMYSPFCIGICTGMMSAETLKKYMCKEIYMIQKIANKLDSMNDLAAEPMEPDTLADIANRLRQIESSCEVDMRIEEHINYLVDEEYHTPASQLVLNLTSAAQLFARAASEDGRRIQLAHATAMVAALFRLFYFMARQLQIIPNCATMNWVNFHCSHQFKEMVGVTESLLDRCFEPVICWDMDESISEAIEDSYRTSLENANKFLDCCIGDQWCALVHYFAIPPLRSEPLRPAISILCQASTAITFSKGCKPSISLGLLVDADQEYKKTLDEILPPVPVPYNYTTVKEAFMTLSLLRDHLHKQVEESKRLAGVSGDQMLENFEEEVEGKLSVKSEFETLVWELELELEEEMVACGGLVNFSSCVYSFDYSEQFLSFIFQDVISKIWASHMIFEEDISTGEVTDLMKYPIVLENLTKPTPHMTICIGNCVDDLLGLLSAEFGIVVDASPDLVNVARQYGVTFRPIFDMLVQRQLGRVRRSDGGWKHEGVLYAASCWNDVLCFVRLLLGIK